MDQVSLSPEHITKSILDACIDKYSSVLTRVYAIKNPKLSAEDALKKDKWRYQNLPDLMKEDDGMTKEQLARLVKWKITHGVYRPFLPGMIQKNTDEDVRKHTHRAANMIRAGSTILTEKPHSPENDTNAHKCVEAALKEVTNLKGVGPATGTLVLSVYVPEDVPFFADEFFHWVVSDYGVKLKYDKKEYQLLWKGARKVIGRIGDVGMNSLEKAAYVILHWDQLKDNEREDVLGLSTPSDAKANAENAKGDSHDDTREGDEGGGAIKPAKTPPRSKETRNTKRKTSGNETSEEAPVPRRSKRGKI